MKSITILGSTGSIGESTLDVIAQHTDKFSVFALTAYRSHEKMLQQCIQHRPQYVVMVEPDAAKQLKRTLENNGIKSQVLTGVDGLVEVACDTDVDYVMSAIVGAAGLPPTLSATKAGKRILIANKESLVMAGELLLEAGRESGAEILPVDSEHNAIFQCFPDDYRIGFKPAGVERIFLTASGGPFLKKDLDGFHAITPEEACKHPTWDMGQKISIDSATMMNKGLEVIEAVRLYALEVDDISVIIHPQSIIHSLVAYQDGSVLAQMGTPDMRIPIAHVLRWPQSRLSNSVQTLSLTEIGRLDFYEPDFLRFPALKLSTEACRAGGAATVILNAANEIAVEAFLRSAIKFTGIVNMIEAVLSSIEEGCPDSIEAVLAVDRIARDKAHVLVQSGKF